MLKSWRLSSPKTTAAKINIIAFYPNLLNYLAFWNSSLGP